MTGDTLDLVTRARAGQAEALGQLCAVYRNYLRTVANARLGPKLREKVEISDVIQETFVEVVRQFPKFNGQSEGALVAWLRHLIGEKLADLARYNGRAKRGGGVAPVALDAPRKGGTVDDTGTCHEFRGTDLLALSETSPSEVVSRRELSVMVSDALKQLPGPEAQVLLLYHTEGESFESIGARLGLSRKVVRRIWARGLKSLRRQVAPP